MHLPEFLIQNDERKCSTAAVAGVLASGHVADSWFGADMAAIRGSWNSDCPECAHLSDLQAAEPNLAAGALVVADNAGVFKDGGLKGYLGEAGWELGLLGFGVLMEVLSD